MCKDREVFESILQHSLRQESYGLSFTLVSVAYRFAAGPRSCPWHEYVALVCGTTTLNTGLCSQIVKS